MTSNNPEKCRVPIPDNVPLRYRPVPDYCGENKPHAGLHVGGMSGSSNGVFWNVSISWSQENERNVDWLPVITTEQCAEACPHNHMVGLRCSPSCVCVGVATPN